MAIETAREPAIRVRSQSRRAAELAKRQFGAITRRQLLDIGLTPTGLGRWLEAGRLYPRYPGVYAYGREDLPMEGELAAGLLFTGTGSAMSGLSGLWWLGCLHRRPELIHIDAPGAKRSRQDLRIRHPQKIERIEIRRLPVAALPRCLLLASEDLSHNSMRLVLARAEFKHLLDLASLQSVLAGARRGTRAIRAAVDAHLPQLARCSNKFERSFVLLCERFRLEIPDPNIRIGRFRPDML